MRWLYCAVWFRLLLAVTVLEPGYARHYNQTEPWAAECTSAAWAVAEAALAHNVGNSTEAAYIRSDLFDQRRALMDAWAEYITDVIQRELKNG